MVDRDQMTVFLSSHIPKVLDKIGVFLEEPHLTIVILLFVLYVFIKIRFDIGPFN